MSSKFDSQIARAKGQGAGTNLGGGLRFNGLERKLFAGTSGASWLFRTMMRCPQIHSAPFKNLWRLRNGFPVPSAERTVARAENFPPLVVLMIPADSLAVWRPCACLQPSPNGQNIQGPIDAACGGNADKRVAFRKTSKGAAAGIIASTCEARPESGFVGHWREHEDYHLPLENAAFDGIEQFLRGFGTLIG